jgi:16S rRNA G966 N2-methylase RsmD
MTAALQISKGTYHRENTIWEEAKVGNEFAKNQLRLIEEGRTTVSKAYNKIVENRNEMRVREARKEQAKLGETLARSDVLYLGKFQEVLDFIPDGTVDAIITDPPYPYDFIECWTDLAKFAAKKLRPGGWLVAYSGQLHLTEVMARLSIPELNYYWTMALYHKGTRQDVWGIDLNVMWKPILVFARPYHSSGNAKPKLDSRGHDDYIISDREEKLGHDWQQSESSVAKLIETFTKPGDFIVEPFAGSGTTIAIAQKLERKVVGAELNAETFNLAKVRLSELKE